MITVGNYKAFHGVMRITPKTKCVTPLEIEGNWLYQPEHKCWYGNGAYYSEEICTVVMDDSEKLRLKKPILDTIFPSGTKWWICPTCENNYVETYDNFCYNCGQALDWSDV